MTNFEQAKMSRNAGLASFLTDNAAAFAADTAFNNAVKKFSVIDYPALLTAAAATGADNAGFSKDKVNAKNAAGEFAASLSASAQVKLEELGKLSIAAALHDAEVYYTRAADAVAAARMQAAHDLMADNQATITDDYVTVAELKELQDLIDTFTSTQGSTEAAHAVSPAATAKFKSALKVVDSDVKTFLKLGKKYKTKNIDFYNALIPACEIPAINVHHTDADITLHDAVSGEVIAGAHGTFTHSKNVSASTSDDNGFMLFEHVGAGNATLKISAAGYKDYTTQVHITAGKENPFTFLMEKV